MHSSGLTNRFPLNAEITLLSAFIPLWRHLGAESSWRRTPGKHKRCQKEALDILKIKEYGRDDEVLEAIIKERSRNFPELSELSLRLNAAPAHTEELLEKLKKQKKILAVNGKSCIHKDYWDIITEFAKQCLNRFHEANPIASGIEKEELKSRLTEHFYLKECETVRRAFPWSW